MDRCWSARRRSGECELLERRRFRSRRPRSRQERQHARRNGDDPGVGPLEGRHSPPLGRLRAARRSSRPHSGPLRAFRTQRWTPGYPRKPVKCPSTPFPSAAGFRGPHAGARLDHQSKVHTLGRRVAVPRRAPLCLPQGRRSRSRQEQQHTRRLAGDLGTWTRPGPAFTAVLAICEPRGVQVGLTAAR